MEKILIVEDEESLRNALVAKITSEGFEVIEARDGKEALDKAFVEHPDLILLDIILPKINGMDVLKKIRQEIWGKDVPVLILTNLSDAEKMAEAIDEKANDYLIKTDWKLADVINKIKEKLVK